MLFHSFAFCIFLPIVFLIYWAMPHRFRWVILLLASYYFYMSWNAKYILLIFLITLITYTAGIMLEKAQRQTGKKEILAAVVICCLSVLILFKYAQFILDSGAVFLQRFSIPLHPITVKLLLPVGISFYTFQSLSYVIDVYRGRIRAERNFGIFATFISFFPQLVAGPIERTGNLLPQIKEKHLFDSDLALTGMKQMLIGYFKKLVIADAVVRIVDPVFASPLSYGSGDMLLAALLFSVQIYCDFSGYSDIAMGVSDLFGIRLSDNFKSPYMAQSIQGFWRRWHISLSSWFRDYIYIPLGGSRKGELRTALNTLIVFLVSGLWHGANWTFILWGLIHGLAQVIERKLGVGRKESEHFFGRWGRRLLVFAFALLTWIFFRADSISDALYVLTHLFSGIANPVRYLRTAYAQLGIDSYTVLCLPYTFLVLFIYEVKAVKKDPVAAVGEMGRVKQFIFCLLFVLMFIMVLPVRSSNEFLYFKF